MEIGLFLCFAILVAVAVNWDHDRIAHEAQSAVKAAGRRRGFLPHVRATWRSLALASGMCAVLAVGLFFHPPSPPFTGRGSWLWVIVHALLGTYAAAHVAIACAVALAAGAIALQSRASKNA